MKRNRVIAVAASVMVAGVLAGCSGGGGGGESTGAANGDNTSNCTNKITKTDVPVVTLATAHPAKFRDAVERATGQRPAMPSRVGSLFDREERYDVLPADLAAIEAYVAERATPA